MDDQSCAAKYCGHGDWWSPAVTGPTEAGRHGPPVLAEKPPMEVDAARRSHSKARRYVWIVSALVTRRCHTSLRCELVSWLGLLVTV